MKGTILKAKLIIAEHFGIDAMHLDKNISRKVPIPDARRMLVYFLREHLELTYNEIVLEVGSITNHATALYHYRRMDELINIRSGDKCLDRQLRVSYAKFMDKLLNKDNTLMEEEMFILTKERKELNKQINNLKKLI